MTRTIFILGANSSLAYALCCELAEKKYNLVLAGRNKEELTILASDLEIRYNIDTKSILLDLSDPNFDYQKIAEKSGPIDDLIVVAGNMGNNDHDDGDNLRQIINTNFTAPAQLITHFSNTMKDKNTGHIVIISSVAGDRGRQSNYFYGSAKAGLSAFASGLRNKLSSFDIYITTVKPGFIDTPMTFSMNSPLVYSRNKAAQTIIKAMEQKKDIIYVPFFWNYIMLIIRCIPERIFKKLRL